MRLAYGITAALLTGGATLSLVTGHPAGAQMAQNDDAQMSRVVPRAGAPASFAELTAQLQPAVVNISTRQRVEVGSTDPFAGTPLEGMFNQRRGRQPQQPQTRQAQSLGSGFIISADGVVVTNNHVINPPGTRSTLESVTVTLEDGTEYEAEVLGADEASDLAVLKINRREAFPFVRFGDSSQARVGDWVIAIGNPFGLSGSVTSGIVSAVYRNTGQGGAYDRYLQTDAAINRGNSGGPLFDMQGNVIGINNAIFSPSGGSVGLGFAIPAEIAAPIVQQLRLGQDIQRGYLGVSIQPVAGDLADALGLPQNRGEFIQSVVPGEAADRAGLRAGDVVISVNDQPITNNQTLSFLVANIRPGQRVPVELIRNGDRRRVNVEVGRRPSEEQLRQSQQGFGPENQDQIPQSGGAETDMTRGSTGLSVLPLNPQIRQQLGLDPDVNGLVIAGVDPSSDAAAKGLQRGDVILAVSERAVGSVADLEAAIRQARAANRSAVLLRVQRSGRPPQSVAIRLR
ncbi:Do family serine endopeptidase [Porphyrobacter sp. GA68]|uniref:Do family serine endopeptidase n=1 Tax=Porphyrobacter sp. GA68 TaxID=2883480 RepID=UPI001D1883A0|nr:Do family serine endopeptidase [Porphyrobacter sp. GA68]